MVGGPAGADLAAVLYTDLLRLTVLLAAAEATVLGTITVLSAGAASETGTLVVAAAWWPTAIAVGLWLGRPSAAAGGVRDALAGARTTTSLPSEAPARIALGRLWPIAVTAVAAGVLGVFYPGVSAIGAGYALLVAVGWRSREAAVRAIEERDAVQFFVTPGSVLRPVELVRTPGLGRDRTAPGHPPPPPPAV
jgi:hypothetical protein